MSTRHQFRLPEEIRWFIVSEKEKNTPPLTIKNNVLEKFRRRISYSTIRLTWARHLKTGSIDYLKPAGRPKTLNPREGRSLVKTFLPNPGTSIKSVIELQDQQPIARKPISRWTLRRTFRSRGLLPKISNER